MEHIGQCMLISCALGCLCEPEASSSRPLKHSAALPVREKLGLRLATA